MKPSGSRPRVVIRADGGGTVGWGHFARCRALAAGLRRLGATVSWACRNERPGDFDPSGETLLLDGEPTTERLPLEEADVLRGRMGEPDWVVVDHYGAGERYLDRLRGGRRKTRILVIDDHQRRTSADLRLAPTQDPFPNSLTGPEYLLISREFSELRPQARSGTLIAFGGVDAKCHTLSVLRSLGRPQTDLAPVIVVANDCLATRQELDVWIRDRPGVRRVAWLPAHELARLVGSVGQALVSASTLATECLVAGTPIVAVQTVDNQRLHARLLTRLGIQVTREAGPAIRMLESGRASRGTAASAIDGRGADRVARTMMGGVSKRLTEKWGNE